MDEAADWETYPCQRLTGPQYLDIIANRDKWVNTSMQASSHGSQVWPPVLPVPKDMGEDVLYSVVECAFIQNRWSCIFLEVEDVHCLGQVWGWFGRELQEIPKYTKPVGTEKTSQINHPASGIGLATVREYTLERNLQEMITIVSVETLNGDGQSVSIPNCMSRLYHIWPTSITESPNPGSNCSSSSGEATLRDYQSDGQNETWEDFRAQAIAKFGCKILDSLDSSLQLVLPGSDSQFLAQRILLKLKESPMVLESLDPYLFYNISQLSRALQQAAMKVLGKNQTLQMQMCALAEEVRGIGFNTATLLLETMDASTTVLPQSRVSNLLVAPQQSRSPSEPLRTVFSTDSVLKCISDVVQEEKRGVGLPIVRFLDTLGENSSVQMLRSTIRELGADVVADILPTLPNYELMKTTGVSPQ